MPVDLTIRLDRNLAYFRIYGHFTVAEGAQAFRDYVDHPEFSPDLLLLTNSERMTSLHAGFQSIFMGVQRLLPLFSRFPTETRSVIYAKGDIAFGMSRVLQQVAEPITKFRFEVFGSEVDALRAAHQTEQSFAALETALGLTETLQDAPEAL